MDPSTHQPKKGKECLGSGIHMEVEVKSLYKAKTGMNRLALGQREAVGRVGRRSRRPSQEQYTGNTGPGCQLGFWAQGLVAQATGVAVQLSRAQGHVPKETTHITVIKIRSQV